MDPSGGSRTASSPPRKAWSTLPFRGSKASGWSYRTFLVEPPRFLPRLQHHLEESGVALRTSRFRHLDDVATLPGEAIVNCLGLGSGSLFPDTRLLPICGQLVHLEPQALDYMLSHGDGYVFPRRDAVVLGGTVERGRVLADPDPATCRRILLRNRSFFAS